jgi:hypothetical protein
MNQAHDMSPGLLRQRRNLIAVSIALIFLEVSEAKIHTFQLMGIHVTFDQPTAVLWMLGLSVAYLTYRYSLYLYQEPTGGLKACFFELLNSYASEKLIAFAKQEFEVGDEQVSILEPLGSRKTSFMVWEVMIGVGYDQYGNYTQKYVDVSFDELWKEISKATVVALLTRSYFTDYVAPYLLSILAITLFSVSYLKL